MVDYKIDGNFEAEQTSWGSFKTVDGLAEFEQTLVIVLHNELNDIIGRSEGNKIQKIKLKINRVAKLFGIIDEIRDLRIIETTEADGSYKVIVTYYSEEAFSEVF